MAVARPGQPALLALSHAVVDEQGNQATASDDQHDDPHGQPDETAWVKRTLVLALLLVLLRCNAVIIVAAWLLLIVLLLGVFLLLFVWLVGAIWRTWGGYLGWACIAGNGRPLVRIQ